MATRILVVDDSEVDRRLVAGLLRKNFQSEVDLAGDGREALDQIAVSPPDLVVTDLVMPELDGLQLVRALRRGYPQIPAILLTAYGNETIAVEALQEGAASYVPKSRQAERLLETVDRVLVRAAADRHRGRLARCMLEYGWRLQLENDPALIRALVSEVQKMMSSVEFSDVGERIRVGEALEEALLNALYHGNLEIGEQELAKARGDLGGERLASLVEERRQRKPYRDRTILCIVQISAAQVRFVVRDQGAGFNVNALMGRDLAASFEDGQRRGLTLIQSLMDEVSFNATGNELTMCKRRKASREAGRLQNA
jgi:CheY-like chemotaxis protein/anti-sigma regulatory factor (Ser/Thr protein kinase)